MSDQQSQKRGVRSEAQKQADARAGYDRMGATSRQEGASGKQKSDKQSDQDLALKQEEKHRRSKQ